MAQADLAEWGDLFPLTDFAGGVLIQDEKLNITGDRYFYFCGGFARMKKLSLRVVAIILGALCAGALLSGAGVVGTAYYAAPVNLSRFMVTLLSIWGMIRLMEKIFSLLFYSFFRNPENGTNTQE